MHKYSANDTLESAHIVQIKVYDEGYKQDVIDLIINIQRNEFDIAITEGQQRNCIQCK